MKCRGGAILWCFAPFPNSLAADRKGIRATKIPSPIPRLSCDVLLSEMVQAAEAAGLNIAGIEASLRHSVYCGFTLNPR